jgi:hypothetical protein
VARLAKVGSVVKNNRLCGKLKWNYGDLATGNSRPLGWHDSVET